MNLDAILNTEKVRENIEAGYLTERLHRELPLAILNYSDACQYDNNWNEVTVSCRGLIYNYETNEIVARPFPKFFNWDHGQQKMPPSGPVLRMEKMDGSLGILYSYSDPADDIEFQGKRWKSTKYAIATRGSFHSEQAEWATRFFNTQMMMDESYFFRPKDGKTYLFEIIYPENRVVVDYGDYRGLVLLDVIDNETGFSDTDEFDNCDWPDKVKRIPMAGFDSGQVAEIRDGEEGFVYLWPARNFRTKMKSAQYIELHKIITGLNEKVVWSEMLKGKSAKQICDNIPDELHAWVENIYEDLDNKACEVVDDTEIEFWNIKNKINPENPNLAVDRAAFAAHATKSKLASYLFARLDGRNVYMLALKNCKPKITPIVVEA